MSALATFGAGLNVVVVGASGGIGAAFVRALAADRSVGRVLAFARRRVDTGDGDVLGGRLDLEDETSMQAAAELARAQVGELNLVLVATGILHDGAALSPEKTWRALEPDALARAFRVNATGPALIAKHFLPLLARDRKTAFAALSARVGSIADNELGGWYAYRASKAALNQLLRTLAIELTRKRPQALCVGLHPGTVDTGLSVPFQANVPDAKLFTADFAAGRLLAVLDGLDPRDTGGLFAWDGERVPY